MDNKKIVEVNGIKLEVDMRYAKRIDEFRVGDTVKVLDVNDKWCKICTYDEVQFYVLHRL